LFLDHDDRIMGYGRDLVGTDCVPADLTVLFRAITDGSLFDALRTATGTRGDGTADLLEFEPEAVVVAEWERKLAGIPRPALRDHLRMLCLESYWAAAFGAHYSGPARCPCELRWLNDQPGHRFVTGWEIGQGEAASAIFALSAGSDT
jgi:hypothetical protein